MVYVGTAGWNIRKEHSLLFSPDGSHLERYASRFNAVEINSSFYKDHQGKTYRRWAESVPRDFRFSVKLSKLYTHQHKLTVVDDHLKEVLEAICLLEDKLGVLLVQLPPKLEFEEENANHFFEFLRTYFTKPIILEPRNPSWCKVNSYRVLNDYRIQAAFADPNPLPLTKGFSRDPAYFRLHGSPIMYRSSYTNVRLEEFIETAEQFGGDEQWFIFDNTAESHAVLNAFSIQDLIRSKKSKNVEANP